MDYDQRCQLFLLAWEKKKKEKKRIWVIFFLNAPLSWHVCGCQVSAKEALNILLVKLAHSHWLSWVSRQRQPDQPCLIFTIWDRMGSDVIGRSKIILIMTPHNWGFFGQKVICENPWIGPHPPDRWRLQIGLKIFNCVASLKLHDNINKSHFYTVRCSRCLTISFHADQAQPVRILFHFPLWDW